MVWYNRQQIKGSNMTEFRVKMRFALTVQQYLSSIYWTEYSFPSWSTPMFDLMCQRSAKIIAWVLEIEQVTEITAQAIIYLGGVPKSGCYEEWFHTAASRWLVFLHRHTQRAISIRWTFRWMGIPLTLSNNLYCCRHTLFQGRRAGPHACSKVLEHPHYYVNFVFRSFVICSGTLR